jgi:peptidoglycan LD-endopeptidase LytH
VRRRALLLGGLAAAVLAAAALGYLLWRRSGSSPRDAAVLEWIRHPEAHPGWAVQAGQRCAAAPFVMPTRGFIGYLWGDTFQAGHLHQGIDIFGGASAGVVEVRAAAAGYLTRLPGWVSSVIVRIPSDPLRPGVQIWTYYTHLADAQGNSLIDAAFPPGVSEAPVKAGTLLGKMGNYSGTPGAPVGVHLHFSIVKGDGQGKFLNELEKANTLDPSPYLGLPLNFDANPPAVPLCP